MALFQMVIVCSICYTGLLPSVNTVRVNIIYWYIVLNFHMSW